MKILLEKGDKVTLLPTSELIKIFNQRNFFTEKDRQEFAIILGGKCGTITSIEDKYSFDYFHFQPDGNNNTWTVPRESVILDTTITLRKADLTERLVEVIKDKAVSIYDGYIQIYENELKNAIEKP